RLRILLHEWHRAAFARHATLVGEIHTASVSCGPMPGVKALRALWVGFESVLDVVLPLRERSARTKSRTLEDIPLQPTSHDLLGAKITTLMDYQNPAVEDLIRSLKYDGSNHAAHLAASVLADFLREEIASEKSFSARKILLVPIPLYKTRARERGW